MVMRVGLEASRNIGKRVKLLGLCKVFLVRLNDCMMACMVPTIGLEDDKICHLEQC